MAGTIGAIGGNDFQGVGVNWQTSIMSLRILDNNNRSDAGAGLQAINYAKMMRDRYEVDLDSGRTVEGADVRVLNNSWGQPGGFEPAFATTVGELGQTGILFVAASGNGILWQRRRQRPDAVLSGRLRGSECDRGRRIDGG